MKLSVKLPLLIIFLVLFFTIGYQSIFYIQIQQNIVDSRISEAKTLIQLSSDEFRNSVYFLNYETINLQIENLKKNPLIENVIIMHSDGRIISDGTALNENFDRIPSDIFIQNSINSDKISQKIEENTIRLSSPIKIIDNIGILQLDYSLADVSKILENSLLVIIIFSSILGVIGIVVGISISTSITKSINKLKNISREIAKGNFDTEFNINKSDKSEINELEKSLEEMSIKMQENQLGLLKAERFSAIGELSARIAHDIRNPLSVIQSSLELFDHLKNDPEKFDKLIKRNAKAVDRITHQIEEVMDFVRHSKLHVEKINLKKTFDTLVSEIEDTDEIKINVPKNDIEIYGDKGKLYALFSNLILNAFQAIEDKGVITISTSKLKDTVKIDIEDTGKGVLDDDLGKIFEPLFTTKQEGTGLGLASCKKIVESHGGSISVKNNPTTFTVILPLVIDPKYYS